MARLLFSRRRGLSQKCASRQPIIPRLLSLEDRTLPSVFTVINLADSGAGSLRQAVLDADHSDGTDQIVFAAGLQGTIALTSGELDITDANLTIAGPGASQLAISGNDLSRVFEIDTGITAVIDGLTITNGFVFDGGGGILNNGTLAVTNANVSSNSTDLRFGGGIANFGTLTLTNATVSGNSAGDPLYIVPGNGGGIANFGTLTLTNARVSGNFAYGGGMGGGIYNDYNDTVTFNNSTLSGNSGNGGGGIHNFGAFTLTNATVSGNRSFDFGGGIYNSGTLHVNNAIIAANSATFTGLDLYGNLGSFGYNLIGSSQGGSGFDPSDLLDVDPMLAPLGDNGGPTQTMALLPSSPALNAGDPAQLGTPDQRGVLRTGGVNIGAFQASASAFVVTAPAMVLPGVPFDITVASMDIFGQTAVGYTGTIAFSTTDPDPGVILPADYPFQISDAGSVTFTASVTLITPGLQAITATDTADNTITGSAMVTVNGTSPDPGGSRRDSRWRWSEWYDQAVFVREWWFATFL